jgi:hypothetical protein
MARNDLEPYSLRIPSKTMTKLGYFADENELSLQEAARTILWDGLKGQKPPKSLELKQIEVLDADWQLWLDLADHFGVDLAELIRQVLSKVAKANLPK